MKRTTLNFVLDSISFLNLLLLATTGVVLKWVLPPGSGGGYGRGLRGGRGPDEVKDLLGLGRHDWGDVHFGLALLFVLLILLLVISYPYASGESREHRESSYRGFCGPANLLPREWPARRPFARGANRHT